MPKKAHTGARACVHVPTDPASAVRLRALGHLLEGSPSTPVLVFEAEATSPLAAMASVRCTPRADVDGGLVLDLAGDAVRLEDHTPPIPPAVPGPDRFPLWPKPTIVAYEPPLFRLAVSLASVEEDLVAWVGSLPADQVDLPRRLAEWQLQADRILVEATDRVRHVIDRFQPDQQRAVQRKLAWLADLVRHGNDDPEAAEDIDDFGQPYLRSDTQLINETYRQVLDACKRLDEADDDRDRSAATIAELVKTVRALGSEVPERLRLAQEARLLHRSLGVARAELLPIVWPGWRFVSDDRLKDVLNPSQAALEALIAARAEPKIVVPEIELKWLTEAERPVLVSTFLGHRIIKEVE